jgi:hypothetical protein
MIIPEVTRDSSKQFRDHFGNQSIIQVKAKTRKIISAPLKKRWLLRPYSDIEIGEDIEI